MIRARDHPRWQSLVGTAELPLGPNYSAAEKTLRNDYSQHFVDSGQLPGNAVRNPSAELRFEEYPKLQRLVQLKDSLVNSIAHPPTYLQADLRPSLQSYRTLRSPETFHLGSLIPVKYDVVLVDPPLEAYEWEGQPSAMGQTWSWDNIAALPVPQVAAKESFVFLWVGSGAGDGLERGREVLAKWGYRRCEDIVWIRTNPQTHSQPQPSSTSAFARSSQHCLMGIRGTVRRSTDTHFVHCNVDTDVILWHGDGTSDMKSKPPELYQIIENFCLGTRRLELFGRNRNLRRGWLTVGLELGPDAPGWPADGRVHRHDLPSPTEAVHHAHKYVKAEYDAYFGVDPPGCELRNRCNLVPYMHEVDQLRPRSPPPRTATESADRSPSDSASYLPHLDVSSPPIIRGAGLSGLGAGGQKTVSIPSGSDTLSGPQASVLRAKAAAELAAAKSH